MNTKIIKNKIIKIIKSLIFLILLLTWSNIPILIFHLDLKNFTLTKTIIYSLICDITFLLLIILVYRKTLIKDFKNFFKNFSNNIEISFKYWFTGFIIMVISNLIITLLTSGQTSVNEEQIRTLIKITPLYMLFDVSIYAPFTEELIFRKSFKDAISNKYLYIFLSGFIFGGLHVISSLSFPLNPLDLLFLIPYCSLGFAFAYSYYKTDNIFSTISMHMLHNTMAIAIYLIGGI